MASAKKIRGMLERKDIQGIVELFAEDGNVMSALLAFTYEEDRAVRWRAFDALGRISAARTESDGLEPLREIVRRLLWSMNDESGGVGWYAAEAAGEMLAAVPDLIDEYGVILASHMNTFPFETSVHRALAGIVPLNPGLFADTAGELSKSLESEDPARRAFAARALIAIDPEKYKGAAGGLAEDDSEISLYDRESREEVKVKVNRFLEDVK